MAKCAYKSDGHRCDNKPVSGSKYCWRHTPTMIRILWWLKTLGGGGIALISVLASLYFLGFNIPIPGTDPLRIDSDYSLYSSGLDSELKVPTGSDPIELLKNTFTFSRNTSSYLEKTNLETIFFAQHEIVAALGLTSKSPVEWLQLNPKTLLRIDDFQNIKTNSDVIIVPATACGGGGNPWRFDIIVKEGDLFTGNIISSLNDARGLYKENSTFLNAFITLQPGEREVFVAFITLPRPGIYRFSLGVEYWFNGRQIQEWTQKPYSVDIPNNYQVYSFKNVSCADSELPEKPIISSESCAFSEATYVCETTIEK